MPVFMINNFVTQAASIAKKLQQQISQLESLKLRDLLCMAMVTL
jgi:hypothetical protein